LSSNEGNYVERDAEMLQNVQIYKKEKSRYHLCDTGEPFN